MPKENKYRRRRDISDSDSSSSRESSPDRKHSRRGTKKEGRKDKRVRSKSRERHGRSRSRGRRGRSRSKERRGRSRSRERRGRSRSKERHRNRKRSHSRDHSLREKRHKRSQSRSDSHSPRRKEAKKDKGSKWDSHTRGEGKAESDSRHKEGSKVQKPKVEVVVAVKMKSASEPNIQKESETDKSGEITIEEVEAVQRKIEEERAKRKERMAAWREAHQKEEEELAAKVKNEEEENQNTKKGWTLSDDDDDDDDGGISATMETGTAEEVNGEDIDPLDAFMVGVKEEVKKVNEEDLKKRESSAAKSGDCDNNHEQKNNATVISVTKVVNDADDSATGKKGELLVNDQDALEYSDEEHGDTELASALSTIFKKGKKKELPIVNHRTITYQPFKKDFYKEVPELARMTPEEVSAYRIELESVKIKGKDCPKPVKNWAQCGLSSKELDIMKKNGYEKPTPIQAQAIPAIMSGRDVIGIAKTGSGKTLAFLLPLLRHVKDQPPLDYDDGPIALILTPTRELAIQIYNECKKFCKPLKLHPVCVYGGAGVSDQIADLKRGAEIVVCTPGRMIDILASNSGRVTNLRRVTYAVLDEADRMFDMGFEPQVMRIVSNIRPDKQTVMFSATFPRQMEALARKILNQPLEVLVGGRSVVCKDVEQTVCVLEAEEKYLKLLELLGLHQENGSILVFVERQEEADYLVKDLLRSGYTCMALHGGMDQSDRDTTLADFRSGANRLLVATSVAARGLDVKHLILVINYDCPNHYEDYVHRCGRTGRAGNKGMAFTFLTPDQAKLSGEIVKALELSGATVPEELNELWTNYIEQMKKEGKYRPNRRRAAGFSGKGFKFNEEENAKNLEKKLKQKNTLGLADSDDEDEYSIVTLDKKLEEVFSGKPQKVDPNAVQVPISKPNQQLDAQASKGLAKAAAIAGKLVSSKNLVSAPGSGASLTQEAASNVLKGESVSVSGAALASQIAASINAKVGAGRAKVSKAFLPAGTVLSGTGNNEEEESDSDDDFSLLRPNISQLVRYEEKLEINDFPQQIRFRITTRDVLDEIGEYAEAYVSVRGIYIPPSRQPKDTEMKLHLLVEAKTERSVILAKQHIKEVITEEAQRLAARVNPHQKSGRYTVL